MMPARPRSRLHHGHVASSIRVSALCSTVGPWERNEAKSERSFGDPERLTEQENKSVKSCPRILKDLPEEGTSEEIVANKLGKTWLASLTLWRFERKILTTRTKLIVPRHVMGGRRRS